MRICMIFMQKDGNCQLTEAAVTYVLLHVSILWYMMMMGNF